MDHFFDQECRDACWARIRARGRRHFLVQYGLRRVALQWGLFFWVTLFVVVPVFFEVHQTPNFGYIGSRPFWLSLMGALVLWPIAGYLLAAIEWRRQETRFLASEG